MNIDRQAIAEKLHDFIRRAPELRETYLDLEYIEDFHHVVSALPVMEKLSWDEIDVFIITAFQEKPPFSWVKENLCSHGIVSLWEYGILLRMWLLFWNGPLACRKERICDVIHIMFYFQNCIPRKQTTVHAVSCHFTKSSPIVKALEDEDAGKIKLLADLMPNPVKAMRQAYGYALNKQKTTLFFKLFQTYGTYEDLAAMKDELLRYWNEVILAGKFTDYFGTDVRQNGCVEFFKRLVQSAPSYSLPQDYLNRREALPQEVYLQCLANGKMIDDFPLIPNEPNLAWFTYRKRAQFLAEYADDFLAVLTPDEPLFDSVLLAQALN